MALIMNQDIQTNSVYKNDGYSEMQLYTDSSSLSKEDESIYKAFSQEASKYAANVSKKKYYDFKTKNKSFLQLYDDLYKMGIKNNKFFLRLYDTTLQGIDPYSPVLPKDIR